VETHLLNFDGDLLGKQIGIQFIERLRDERPFGSVKDLSLQIRKDILEAGKVFGSSENDLTKPFSSGYRKSS
jgi:riboflavin kinase/FMN adenylyltransferase